MSAHPSALPDVPGDFPQRVREDLVARGDVRLRVSTILLAPDYYDTAIMDDRDDQRHAGWLLGDWVINSGSRRRDTLAEAEALHQVALTAAWAADPTPPPAAERDEEVAAALDRFTPQQCPRGLHADWSVDSENVHACPWCLIAELRGVKADLEDRLAARLIELAARPTWSAAADEADFVASTLDHHDKVEQAAGAWKVAERLREKDAQQAKAVQS